jgi:hypothetical protein
VVICGGEDLKCIYSRIARRGRNWPSCWTRQRRKEGSVLIKRRDGSVFELRPVSGKKSPLDVKGVNLGLNSEEISGMFREIRER